MLPTCHCEERSDVAISQTRPDNREAIGEIATACMRLPRPRWGLAMTNLGALRHRSNAANTASSRRPPGSCFCAMLLFLRGLGGDLDEAVVRLIEDGRAPLADGEDALVFLALGDGVFERPQHGGIVDLARDGMGRERDGLFVVEGRLRDHVHKDKRVVVYAEIISQLVVQRGALVAFERGGVVARVVVIPCIARRSARADDQQRQQEGDEAAGDLQLLRRLIRQLHAVGQRGNDVQEQDEKQRLDREEHEVLADARQVEDRIGLAKDHLVIQQHDRRLDDDVHEEAHAEAGERHTKVRQRRTVQEQSKDQGTGDLREDERGRSTRRSGTGYSQAYH